MAGGRDRVELMASLSIIVKDGTGGDNLYLERHGICIPYNITNFMLYSDSKIVTDVLRRFRERQMDIPPTDEESLAEIWQKAKNEIDLDNMIRAEMASDRPICLPEKSSVPVVPIVNPIIEKKQHIRNLLIEKGLLSTESE